MLMRPSSHSMAASRANQRCTSGTHTADSTTGDLPSSEALAHGLPPALTLVIKASEVKQALQVQMVKVHGEIKATMKKVLIITLETMLLGMVVFTLK